jgi:hypothetical protein
MEEPKKDRRATDKKDSKTPATSMDKDKKKKIIIGGGLAGVLVLGYLYYKNKTSTAASTATTAAATAPGGGTSGWNGGGGDSGGGGSSGGGGGGGLTTNPNGSQQSFPVGPLNPTTGVPGTPNGTGVVPYDSAVTTALTKAKAALAKATKSGNKTAVANATSNLNRVQGIQKSRTAGTTNAGGAFTPKAISSTAVKGGKTQISTPVSKAVIHSSGGTAPKSGATSTHKTVKTAVPVQAKKR